MIITLQNIKNVNWVEIERKSEQLRLSLGLRGKIKIERVWKEGHLGCEYIMVQYLDYNSRCRDEANLSDIIDWINWEEKFVDNFTFLKLQVEGICGKQKHNDTMQSNVGDDVNAEIERRALGRITEEMKRSMGIRGWRVLKASENSAGCPMYYMRTPTGNFCWYTIVDLEKWFKK